VSFVVKNLTTKDTKGFTKEHKDDLCYITMLAGKEEMGQTTVQESRMVSPAGPGNYPPLSNSGTFVPSGGPVVSFRTRVPVVVDKSLENRARGDLVQCKLREFIWKHKVGVKTKDKWIKTKVRPSQCPNFC
jgi:hypothetical protein